MKRPFSSPLLLLLSIQATALLHAQDVEWKKMGGPIASDGYMTSNITVVATDSKGNIYAGSDDGIFVSGNNGQSWSSMISGSQDPKVYAIAIDTNDDIYVGMKSGVFVRRNGESGWNDLSDQLPSATVYALTIDGNGYLYAMTMAALYRSVDKGASWDVVGDGITHEFNYWPLLAVGSDGRIYASNDFRLFQSLDKGLHFTKVANVGFVSMLNLNDASMMVIATSAEESIVYRSSGGGSFGKVILPFGSYTMGPLAKDSRGWIYAGSTFFGGAGDLFVSQNRGVDWSKIPFGTSVSAMLITKENYIFIGTKSSGIYRSLRATAGVGDDRSDDRSATLRADVHPNPSGGACTISYALNAVEYVTLKIHDARGNEIATLVDGLREAGDHTATFLPDDLPAGAYFYRLQAGGRSITRGILLAK